MNTVVLSRLPRGRTRNTMSCPLLHLRFDAVEIVFAVHRLLVDLDDDVAAAQSCRLAKAVGLHILHDDALGVRQLVTISQVLGDAADRDAELAFLRLAFLVAFFLAAQTGGKELGAIGDGDLARSIPCRYECSRPWQWCRASGRRSRPPVRRRSSPVLPFTDTMVSPVFRPAFSAGPLGVMLAMVTPLLTP